MATKKASQLHALLVGIDTYINRGTDFEDLRGCAEDVRRVKAYLEEPFVREKYIRPPVITPLVNEKARKADIIAAFKNDLGKASPGDVVLFYFSGHGVREKTAIKAFKEDEFDGNISALVCYESNPKKHKDPKYACLSDKELRFLIHQLEQETGAHIVCISDCCHSGENTRSMRKQETPLNCSRQIERHAVSPRHPDGYSFGDQQERIFNDIQAGKSLKSILPEGRHIQLSACREVELAMEAPPLAEVRHGVFTAALLDVLTQFEGDISYDELYQRVLNRMPTYAQDKYSAQTPQMYISTLDSRARYQTFLTHTSSDKKLTCSVVAGGDDATGREWKATAGTLQGIPIDPKKRPKELIVKSAKDDAQTWTAQIDEVLPGHCLLSFPTTTPPLDDATLFTQFEGFGREPLKIFVGGPDTQGVELVKNGLQQELSKAEKKFYELIEQEEAALYTLHIEDGILMLTKPFVYDKPLLLAISLKDDRGAFTPKKVSLVNQDLIQIASWHFLKELEYQEEHDLSEWVDEENTMFPVELRMHVYDEQKKEEKRQFPDKRNTFTFDLSPDEEYRLFRLELINHSDTDYFCSLLYLSNMYGVSAQMMTSPQLLLGPSQKVLSSKGNKTRGDRKYITMNLQKEAYIRHFNWDGISYFFKLIVSKTPFDVEKLQMKSLPRPARIYNPRGGTKSTFTLDDGDLFEFEPEMPDVQWEIHTFELHIVNPYTEDV